MKTNEKPVSRVSFVLGLVALFFGGTYFQLFVAFNTIDRMDSLPHWMQTDAFGWVCFALLMLLPVSYAFVRLYLEIRSVWRTILAAVGYFALILLSVLAVSLPIFVFIASGSFVAAVVLLIVGICRRKSGFPLIAFMLVFLLASALILLGGGMSNGTASDLMTFSLAYCPIVFPFLAADLVCQYRFASERQS